MKAAFHTLGCKVNSYETEAILEQFKGLGFDIVDFTEPADVYVVNTCSVTQMAEHKSRQMLHRARKLNPDALIVATGCYAQRAPEELSSDPSIGLVVGNNRKSEIAHLAFEMLNNKSAGHEAVCFVDDLTKCRAFEPQRIGSQGENVRTYVKIQDGCDRFCSYCIIPYVRGRSRSRAVADILEEVRGLAGAGYKEVVLTGIDISTFAPEDSAEQVPALALAELIEKVQLVDGIDRIRLGSLEASIITEEFLRRAKDCYKFCPHFHLSLQSGCDETLKRMNRKYKAEDFLEEIRLIRSFFEKPGVTTDIIVGFAGESEAEFAESLQFAKRAEFTQSHVFKYSRREGTHADKAPNQVTNKVKDARSKAMLEVTDELHLKFMESLLGSVQSVLFEEQIEDAEGRKLQVGFTPEYVRIGVETDEVGGADLTNIIAGVIPERITQTPDGPVLVGPILRAR